MNFKIDNLQYCNWSREIFQINRKAGLDAIHVTIVYHEDFDELKTVIKSWENHFSKNSDLIFHGKSFKDIEKAKTENKTAVFFGFQNCSPIEDDISLVEKVYDLGCRFMQLTYNNQSLLATGCYESVDSGVTNFGREVIKEMNRLGLVIDMSHSAEKSTIDAIEISERPIALTHANPSFWHPAKRNKSNELLKILSDNKGILGLSLYPHHLKDGTDCSLESFCEMIAKTAEIMGTEKIGIGSDLCLNQPDTIVEWMRNGTWTINKNFGEGSKNKPGFPKQPNWFLDARGFKNLEIGLKKVGFSETEVNGILGNNWYNFYKEMKG
ncbi:dipeptidase [Candidatus Pelagibacter sp.]|nr:dipeptidase [Candidatus Pelagibacter sp.]